MASVHLLNSACFVPSYGGFSISIDPGFSPSFMSFMKGFNGVVAVANIRGGGEYGEAWWAAHYDAAIVEAMEEEQAKADTR